MKPIYWNLSPKLRDELYDQSYKQKQISRQLRNQLYDRLSDGHKLNRLFIQLDWEICGRRHHRSLWRKIIDRLNWKR